MTILTRLKQHFFIEPASLHHAFCTLLIAILTYTYLYYQPTRQATWLILSSFLLSQGGLNAELNWRSSWKVLYYLLGGLLTAIPVFILSLTSWFVYTALIVFILVFACSYVGWQNRQYYFAAFTISLLSIVASFMPCSLELALERFYLILLASFLVFILRFLFFLYQRSHAFLYAKVLFFQKLKKVYQLIFYTPEQPRGLFRLEREESHFQRAWSDCLAALEAFKTKVSRSDSGCLDSLWDLTLSLGSLRYRLTDYTVLTMSQGEMQTLLTAILSILNELLFSKSSNAFSAYFDRLQGAIQGFEALYRSTLQTVAKEPLVLLLFIQDLYALKEALEKLSLNFLSSDRTVPEEKSGGHLC